MDQILQTPRIKFLTFAPRNGFYIRFKDIDGLDFHKTASLPASLHNKLSSRQIHLPPVSFLNMSESNGQEIWFIRFNDGSTTWSSGVQMYSEKLWEAITNVDFGEMMEEDDDAVSYCVFAPNNGWFLQFRNGECCFERLPKSLNQLLEEKGIVDCQTDPETAKKRLIDRALWKKLKQTGSLNSNNTQNEFNHEARRLSNWRSFSSNSRRPSIASMDALDNTQSNFVTVESMSIGANGSWFVLFDDGEFLFEDLPTSLDICLNLNLEEADPLQFDVFLSPSDPSAYVVSFEDGSIQYSVPEEMLEELNQLKIHEFESKLKKKEDELGDLFTSFQPDIICEEGNEEIEISEVSLIEAQDSFSQLEISQQDSGIDLDVTNSCKNNQNVNLATKVESTEEIHYLSYEEVYFTTRSINSTLPSEICENSESNIYFLYTDIMRGVKSNENLKPIHVFVDNKDRVW
ncbi:hypothetical protein HK099_005866 [Clydaea vesicula]|uniref:Uncharacterized protein n=1 Tax=Clydaea vesicula TaxID=447962 RepID=A0AAD5TYI5_9FUNG|nr:hypothetical protein HK099_005866 [Clydaea vesicula]